MVEAGQANLVAGMCTPVGEGTTFFIDLQTATACTIVHPSNPPPSPVSWDSVVSACGVTGPACRDGVCAPDIPQFRTCIWASGDLSCPVDWPDKDLVHQDFDDTRDCSSCSCAGLEGVDCDGTVVLSTQDACDIAVGGSGTEICLSGGGLNGAVNIQWTPNDPAGTCMPSGGQSMGGVTPSEPLTLCCLP
jgi:hypothetical protein